jgi:hypothetical protein
MEATLRAYAKILESDSKGRSKQMDEVVAAQSRGELTSFLQKRWEKTCK